jgi:hypothetical protein
MAWRVLGSGNRTNIPPKTFFDFNLRIGTLSRILVREIFLQDTWSN